MKVSAHSSQDNSDVKYLLWAYMLQNLFFSLGCCLGRLRNLTVGSLLERRDGVYGPALLHPYFLYPGYEQ